VAEPRAPNGSATTLEIVETARDRFAVRGALTFHTARQGWEAGIRAFTAAGREIEVDCGGVTRADSAGLAVLITWLAWGYANDCHLVYRQLPADLSALARISEAQRLLGADPA
jgi:phospholipid transport system transporter-binding protein